MSRFDLRPVDLAFSETAEKTYICEGRLRAGIDDVWRAVADATTWADWFPGVERADYSSPPPHGVGAKRRSVVSGATYEETMLAWEAPHLWVYRIDRCSLPIAKAQMETTELESDGTGTLARWTLATDRRLLLRLASPFLDRHLQKLWTTALGNLDAYIASARRQG
jgi:carbon monoxide dehydrogenase subunit G